MTITHVMGIDPGANGGLTVLDILRGRINYHMTFAGLSVFGINEIVPRWLSGMVVVYIEKVHAMPGQGVSTMFTFGRNLGHIEMAIASMLGSAREKHLHHVPASVWTQSVIRSKAASPKMRARETAQKLWPDEPFLDSVRAKVPHEGLVDSALIAEYGRRAVLKELGIKGAAP